ncbi:Zinc finger BED domain-containing protein 3 [Bienertia sinuspersici]
MKVGWRLEWVRVVANVGVGGERGRRGERKFEDEGMADQDQQNFDVNESTEKQKIGKAKKRTSTVWNHYDLVTKIDGAWAVCKYCKHEMKAVGHVRLTNARRHTEKCDAYAKFVETNPASNVVYDYDTYVRMFAESIIYHG